MTFANRRLFQNFIIELFKINLIKKVKKRKRKANDEQIIYDSAFERVLTYIMI